MRYLGVDFGTKRVGIALSDESGAMGFPHTVLPNDDRLMSEIRAIIAKENVGAVVFGDSRDFSGNENPVAKEAQAFAKQLTEESGLPVFFELEALTTQEARRGFDGERSIRESVDSSAAALILTSYLSRSHD